MHRLLRPAGVLAAAAAALLAACSDPLSVTNRNNPSRDDILRLSRDVEGLTSRIYQGVHAAHFAANDNLDNQLKNSSFENASTLANFGMGARLGMPRGPVDNSLGNAVQVGNRRDYALLVTAAGTAVTALERLFAPNFSISGNAAQDARAKAFAFFGYGVALGDVALAYDSTAIPRPGVSASAPLDSLPLVAADSAMRVAIRALDSALVYAPNGPNTIPSDWLRTSADLPRGDFIRLIRSYRARLRANVARSAAERAAVDWNAVIADATNGIQSDYVVNLTPTGGWDYAWLIQHFTSVSWHQMTPMIIGMADSSGAYDAWLATPRNTRTPFLIVTRDRRFPSGNTRAAQQAVSPQGSNFVSPDTIYFRNRPTGDDPSGQGFQNSQYDHNRWRGLFNASRVGPWVTFPVAENDLLAAEGYIRTGNIAAATALIDKSRVRNRLPALSGVITALGQPVPGGRSCVPRVPDAAQGYTATKCGDVFEALKWEKRMETAYAGWSQWYFDSRGWNDLPPGTPLQWPVPYQELQSRLLSPYSIGGVGGPSSAPSTNTYGFGTTPNL